MHNLWYDISIRNIKPQKDLQEEFITTEEEKINSENKLTLVYLTCFGIPV